MCGIFFYQGKKSKGDLKLKFNKLRHRGPDNSELYSFYRNYKNTVIGFHRLSINDTTAVGDQPIELGHFILICNGEIYNHKQIINTFKFNCRSYSDCEVILHLFKHFFDLSSHLLISDKYNYAIEQTLQRLDGVFAFVIYDIKYDSFIVARDPFGIRPLFKNKQCDQNQNDHIYQSDKKNKNEFGNIIPETILLSEIKGTEFICEPFKPGHYYNSIQNTYNKYDHFGTRISWVGCLDTAIITFREMLIDAVNKRITNTDKEIGCFLSGGLDSTIIACIANNILRKNNKGPLKTFSVAFVDDLNNTITEHNCPDAYFAKKISDILQTDHTTLRITMENALDAIPRIIYHLESYDTTTVRASTAQFLLSKFINENTNIKVLLSGEGSDELFGGYKYFLNAPNTEEFKTESNRLLDDLHLFDVLRTDRTVSGNGLEIRVPFLDLSFVHLYKKYIEEEAIRVHLKFSKKKLTKCFLRQLFHSILGDSYENKLLILRPKEAFSDAVGYKWVDSINQKTEHYQPKYKDKYIEPLPRSNEEYWYRDIFIDHFGPDNQHLIPYFWMPKWLSESQQTLIDPSARFL